MSKIDNSLKLLYSSKKPTLINSVMVVIIMSISIFAYSQYGLNGKLLRDHGIYIYSGQQLTKGVPPYVSIFDFKGPVIPIISGFGVSIADYMNYDHIYTVRFIFLLMGAASVPALYVWAAKIFRSNMIGLLSCVTFLGFWGFGIRAASGPQAKVPLIVFEILFFLFLFRKNWFKAGLLSSLSVLTWQVMGVLPIIAIFLAGMQKGNLKIKFQNVMRVGLGITIPILVVSLYFIYYGAFPEFIEGFVTFIFNYITRVPSSIGYHLSHPVLSSYNGYHHTIVQLTLGMITIFYLIYSRIQKNSGIKSFLQNDNFAGLFLFLPIMFVWSMIDFQGYTDAYIFLPISALGFGWLAKNAIQRLMRALKFGSKEQMWIVISVCLSFTIYFTFLYKKTSRFDLRVQRQWAEMIDKEYIAGSKMVAVAVPEILSLLHRTNPNRHIVLDGGEDVMIDEKYPNGFTGWINSIEKYNPKVIIYSKIKGRFQDQFEYWLNNNYTPVSGIYTWTCYLKNGYDVNRQ